MLELTKLLIEEMREGHALAELERPYSKLIYRYGSTSDAEALADFLLEKPQDGWYVARSRL